MKDIAIRSVLSCSVLIGAACGSDSEPEPFGSAAGSGTVPAAGSGGSSADAEVIAADCSRGVVEPDFQAAPLAGPAVRDGQLTPGDYVISSTYLQLRQEPAAQARFGELMQGIMADIAARPGLLAVSLGSAPSCGVARTLSIWRDDVAMLEFVSSPAHTAAMSSVTQVSRGGSIVTHWSGDATSATWQSAAEYLAADEGPFY